MVPFLFTTFLIILTTVLITRLQRKLRLQRKVFENDRIVKEIIEKMERYEQDNELK